MDWKSEQEWLVMRYFRENCPELPKGRLVKGESPDFQLWISPKRFIGIELTQVHQAGNANAQGFLNLEMAIIQIKESLRAKELKTRLYRSSRPHELWLIIFADYSEGGALEKVKTEFLDNVLETSFDRVFLFDLDTREAIQFTDSFNQ